MFASLRRRVLSALTLAVGLTLWCVLYLLPLFLVLVIAMEIVMHYGVWRAVVLPFLILMLLLWSYPRLSNIIRALRCRWREDEYVLIIGSFSRVVDDDDVVGEQLQHAWNGSITRIPRHLLVKYLKRIEDELLNGLTCSVVRIGGKLHRRVIRLSVPDHAWYETFRRLAAGARAILLVPGAGESLLREVVSIRDEPSLMRKTLVAQPRGFVFDDDVANEILLGGGPYPPWDDQPISRRLEQWRVISDTVRDATGVVLPKWSDAGQIVRFGSIDPCGPCDTATLNRLVDAMEPALGLSTALRQPTRTIKEGGVLQRQ